MTYRLIDTRDETVVKEWGVLPGRIHIPGVFSLSPVSVGDRQGDHLIVEVERNRPGATKFHTKKGESEARNGSKTIVTETFGALTVSQAKARLITQIKRSAGERLSETDWQVLRSVEESERTVPAPIKAQRTAIRSHSNSLEAQVNALTTLAELDAWQESGWPE